MGGGQGVASALGALVQTQGGREPRAKRMRHESLMSLPPSDRCRVFFVAFTSLDILNAVRDMVWNARRIPYGSDSVKQEDQGNSAGGVRYSDSRPFMFACTIPCSSADTCSTTVKYVAIPWCFRLKSS